MKKINGYTIIELLVIIAIIAVSVVITISNFPKFKLQLSLSRISYKFEQDLRRAQDMALSQIQYKDSNGNIQDVSGYGIYADISSLGNKKYIIYADRSPGNQQYDALDYLVDTIDFSASEPNVVIKNINNVSSNQLSANFNSSDSKTTITQLNPGQNNADIIFALESDLTKTKTVSINTAGLVEVK